MGVKAAVCEIAHAYTEAATISFGLLSSHKSEHDKLHLPAEGQVRMRHTHHTIHGPSNVCFNDQMLCCYSFAALRLFYKPVSSWLRSTNQGNTHLVRT